MTYQIEQSEIPTLHRDQTQNLKLPILSFVYFVSFVVKKRNEPKVFIKSVQSVKSVVSF
jgi:hypothetical protein